MASSRSDREAELTVSTLHKNELIREIAYDTGVTQAEVRRVVDGLATAVVRALWRGDKVVLTGVGTFEVRTRSARRGINPQTLEAITIPGTTTPGFVVSGERGFSVSQQLDELERRVRERRDGMLVLPHPYLASPQRIWMAAMDAVLSDVAVVRAASQGKATAGHPAPDAMAMGAALAERDAEIAILRAQLAAARSVPVVRAKPCRACHAPTAYEQREALGEMLPPIAILSPAHMAAPDATGKHAALYFITKQDIEMWARQQATPHLPTEGQQCKRPPAPCSHAELESARQSTDTATKEGT